MNVPAPFRRGVWRTPLLIAGCLGVLGGVVGITIALQDALAQPRATTQVSPPLPEAGGHPAEPAPPDPPGSTVARAEAISATHGMAGLAGRWLHAYRLSGGPVIIAGHPWMGGSQAATHGVRILTGSIAPGIPGSPADGDMGDFLAAGLTGPGGLVRLSVPMESGQAKLYLWLSSTLPISAATLHMRVDAQMVSRLVTAGQGPNWCCVGPIDVHNDSGHLALEIGNLGRAVLCGLALTAG